MQGLGEMSKQKLQMFGGCDAALVRNHGISALSRYLHPSDDSLLIYALGCLLLGLFSEV